MKKADLKVGAELFHSTRRDGSYGEKVVVISTEFHTESRGAWARPREKDGISFTYKGRLYTSTFRPSIPGSSFDKKMIPVLRLIPNQNYVEIILVTLASLIGPYVEVQTLRGAEHEQERLNRIAADDRKKEREARFDVVADRCRKLGLREPRSQYDYTYAGLHYPIAEFERFITLLEENGFYFTPEED